MKLCLLLTVTCLAGCPHSPSPADAGPAPPHATTVETCTNLARLHCPEGLDTSCVATFDHIIATKLILLDKDCLAAARNKAEARACGAVECR